MHIPRIIRNLAALTVAMVVSRGIVIAQDTRTYQLLRIERVQAPGTYIRLAPPSTGITPYTLEWSGDSPVAARYITAVGLTSPYKLLYSTPVSNMVVTTGSINITRDPATVESGTTATPGYTSDDFQGSRSSSSQTASAGQAVILGGSNNTGSGYQGSVGGGTGNLTGATQATLLGGQNNTGSGYRTGILGGDGNQATASTVVVFGGQNNTASVSYSYIGAGTGNVASGSTGTIFGGVNNAASSDRGAMVGGFNNTTSANMTVALGGANNASNGNRGIIVGGLNNTSSSNDNFIGGGYKNSAIGSQSTSWGADSNSVSGQYGVNIGGRRNRSLTNQAFIGAGQENYISGGTHATITSGYQNTSSANGTTIGGGSNNSITSQYTVVPGGRNMTVSGQNTFAYNAGTAMSISQSNTGVIANADIWLPNNDNTRRTVRFYEQNNGGALDATSTNYVALVAPASTVSNLDNTYTMPDRVGAATNVLALATGATTTAATMEWVTTPAAPTTSGTINVNANPFTLTAAQTNNSFVRLVATNAAVVGAREVRLANGDVDGRIIRIRAVDLVLTIQINDANNINSAGNFVMSAGDMLTLVWDGANNQWVEIQRTNI